jgi:hypothetical protein
MNAVGIDHQLPPLDVAVKALNDQLSAFEANPRLAELERNKAYLGHSSVHAGSPLKEEALIVCASVDEDSPLYTSHILPLMVRIERFFAHQDIDFEFMDEVRMLRAKRQIDQGHYQQADATYRHIAYGPLYATAFEQRNKYFLTAAKNHLHLFKKLTAPAHMKHQLLAALSALQYVQEYPHTDDIYLYQNAQALFAHNHYQVARMLVFNLCKETLAEQIKTMNQNELLLIYHTLLPYKLSLSEHVINNRMDRLHAVANWYEWVKILQQHFVAQLFENKRFHQPDAKILSQADDLLNEPTSTVGQLQHLVGKTSLEKNFQSALSGDKKAEQKLWDFFHLQYPQA